MRQNMIIICKNHFEFVLYSIDDECGNRWVKRQRQTIDVKKKEV